MTLGITVENENLFQEAIRTGLNLFAGSGFSVCAKDSEGKNLPLGVTLATELRQEFNLSNTDALTLPQICTILLSDRAAELNAFLRVRFSVDSYDPRYDVIREINIPSILTTNIDDLFARVLEHSNEKYLHDLVGSGAPISDQSAVEFIPLHGSVMHPEAPLTFTTLDVAASFSEDPDKWHFLTERLQKRPTLFWGYSLSDAGVLQALHPRTVHNRSHQHKWIALNKSDNASEQYFRAMGFYIIIGDTGNLLDYLTRTKATTETVPVHDGRNTERLFPYEAVPRADKGPVRPVLDFYMGSEPTWHDVFSGQIARTHHYSSLLDAILSKKHVIVVGTPASGKSTLLMQTALGLSFNGHKLMTDSLTVKKAELFLRKLREEKAVLFLDNFADNIEAFGMLTKTSNVQVIAFDREYNYEIASHRIDKKNTKIIDVTELTNTDVQEIYQRIPDRIRSNTLNFPSMEADAAPSLFEVVERNVVGPKLRDRFASVLHQLEKQGTTHHDLFIMLCYVHSCRTPVSFDMAAAFLRDDVATWEDVQEALNCLGGLLTDYSGNLIDSDQDHFIPRSTHVSEAVITASSAGSLRRVLVKFHKNVTPLRICRFDVFKRRGYDADLAKKAFQDWEEGKAFYQSVYDRLQSPFVLQQGALYLAHKRQFRESFGWIDKAVTDTNRRVLSIRNSHAIILFRANIEIAGDSPTRHQTLKQSMDILAECYKFDRRKTYHAVVFADHAVQYWDVYGSDAGHKYLETAKEWLVAELRSAPWNRKIQRLDRLVTDRLGKSCNK